MRRSEKIYKARSKFKFVELRKSLFIKLFNFENFFEKLLTPTQRNSLEYAYREEEMTMMTVNMDGLKDSVVQMLAGEPVSINIGTFSNNMTIFVTKNNSDIT